MNNTLKKIMFFIVLALLSSLFAAPVSASEKDVVIKLATLPPEGNSWVKMLRAFNDDVAKKTGNKLRFKIYPGGSLGDEKDIIRKMKIGQIQAAAITSSGLTNIFREIEVLQVPFAFQNYNEVDLVLKKTEPFFKKGFDDNGYVLLGFSEVGFVYIMSSTAPAYGVADLKKGKVWVQEDSHLAKAIFDTAKVTAIPLSIPDVLVGLQTGLVDIVYIPPTGAISLQWFTKVKYLTNTPLSYIAGAIVIKKEVFNRLSPANQGIIVESARSHLEQLKSVARAENQEALKVMAKHGVKIVSPTKEQVDEFRKLSSDAMGRVIGKSFSKSTMDEVNNCLSAHRKGAK